MDLEKKVSQHDELLAKLIHTNQISEKRLRQMEIVVAVSMPVLVSSFIIGIGASLKAFGVF